ncbi:MAG: acetylglutamate kinase [Gemmataceae bacterium]|nr:acetylglutamate kinase [Gemmataceae bacterium]MDW8242864.1 acetylglutamate kinase [Thermogemmata sp.]
MIPGLEAVGFFASAVEKLASQRHGMTLIKVGGSALDDPQAAANCVRNVSILHQMGLPMVLLHGGGKAIDRAMADAGLTPRKVAGRRYTDTQTLLLVVQVLEQINRTLTQQLQQKGVAAVSALDLQPYPVQGELLRLTGADGTSHDLGWVGTVATVDRPLLEKTIWERKQLPVFPCLAAYTASPNGWLNVNADTLAACLGGALAVQRAIFLTDTPGVLRDPQQPTSLISELTVKAAQELITQGVISGGMIPKVEACLEALAAGVPTAVILDGRRPFALLELFLDIPASGTRFRS